MMLIIASGCLGSLIGSLFAAAIIPDDMWRISRRPHMAVLFMLAVASSLFLWLSNLNVTGVSCG